MHYLEYVIMNGGGHLAVNAVNNPQLLGLIKMMNLDDLMKQVKGAGEDVGPVLLPPTMDFVFKGLFGNEKRPELLTSFLNAVLMPDEPITSITFKDRVLDKQYKNDKLGSLDILATTNKDLWY